MNTQNNSISSQTQQILRNYERINFFKQLKRTLKHQYECLYAYIVQCKTDKDGLHTTNVEPKTYTQNKNFKSKYKSNVNE